MPIFTKLSDIAPTQVLAKGMQLNEVLSHEFLEEINAKLGANFSDIVCSGIHFQLLPKIIEPPKIKEGDNKIELQFIQSDFLRFEHPTPEHHKDKVIVITTNRVGHINQLVKK